MFLKSSNLAALRFFEASARLLSFKRASRELNVTQGAVSQQIQQLEKVLDCALFFRRTRQIALTQEGIRFARLIERTLGELDREARAIASKQSPAEIRVRAGPSFALRWLVPRLGDFYARCPQIKLFIDGAYGYFDPTRSEFDLAVEMLEDDVSSFESEPLMDEYLFPVCSPTYLSSNDFLKRPSDLARSMLLHDAHAWVGREVDAEWRYWLAQVGATDVDSSQGQHFSLANMSIEAALTNQGVAMGRASLVSDLLDAGQLVAPFDCRVKSPAKYCLLYPKELQKRPELRSVIEWLHEQARR